MGRTQKDKENTHGYRKRLKEITSVLHKHAITRGVSPEKLRLILEDLGPTYIKLGQIMSMRSDILPKKYCDELILLCSDVPPMPFEQVEEVLENAFGCYWREEFEEIAKEPLGAASIAQVHRAVLKTGEEVVVKVQRKGIYETMAQDIGILHKAAKLLPKSAIGETIDLDMVLDELWEVAQEEMNFLIEASNMEVFARKNKDVAFVGFPALYRKYTTPKVLVMEYIKGFTIDNKEKLIENGYVLNEIGTKLVDNYIKQVMEDGFFHADPHPGNIMIRDGKIVWMDMGMMGQLSEYEREMIGQAIQGLASEDSGAVQKAVLALGEFSGKPDQSKLNEDIRGLMAKYSAAELGNIDLAEMMQSLMDVMKENKITMPQGMTLLARSMAYIQSVIADISPEINIIDIASMRVKKQFFSGENIMKELKHFEKSFYRSVKKVFDIPSLAAEVLQGYMSGHAKINLDLHVADELEVLLRREINDIVIGLWVMALLISSSIICTTDMIPRFLGIPLLGVVGYVIAFVIIIINFVRFFIRKKKNK